MGLQGNGYEFDGNTATGTDNNGYLATELPPSYNMDSPIKNGHSYKVDTGQPIGVENGNETEEKEVPHYTIRSTLLGCFVSTLASLFLAVGHGCIQLLEGAVGDFQLAALRGLFQSSMGATFYICKRRVPRIPRDRRIWAFLYSLCAVTVNVTFHMGLRFVPAGIAACIRRVVDMVLVTVLSVTLLREKLTVMKILSVTLCLIGVTMLIQPWYDRSDGSTDVITNSSLTLAHAEPSLVEDMFNRAKLLETPDWSYSSSGDTDNSTAAPSSDGLGEDIIGYILVGVAGMMSAFATLTQKYQLPKLNTWTLNLCSGTLGFVLSSTISLATEELTLPSEWEKIVFVFVQAVTWGLAAILRVKGVTLAPAVLMTVVMAMQIVFLLIGQYTVLSTVQPGIGNWVEILGAVLVIVAIVTPPSWQIIHSKRRTANRKRAPSCANIEFSLDEGPETETVHN